MMSFRRKAVFTAALALTALAMLLTSGCQGAVSSSNTKNGSPALDIAKGGSYGESGPADNGISVSGQGSVTVEPDVAHVTLGVETSDTGAAKARETNNTAMEKVLASVKPFGIADEDITTTNYSIYPVYDDKGQKITGYRMQNTVSVKVKNLDKLGALLTAATDAGANTSYGIRFDVLDRTQAYHSALKEAMAKARARAEMMADALGVKVGKVLTINESSGYSGPVYAMPEDAIASKSAAVPVQSGTMDVMASVSVVYEIVK